MDPSGQQGPPNRAGEQVVDRDTWLQLTTVLDNPQPTNNELPQDEEWPANPELDHLMAEFDDSQVQAGLENANTQTHQQATVVPEDNRMALAEQQGLGANDNLGLQHNPDNDISESESDGATEWPVDLGFENPPFVAAMPIQQGNQVRPENAEYGSSAIGNFEQCHNFQQLGVQGPRGAALHARHVGNAQNIQHNMQPYGGLPEMQMQEPQGAALHAGHFGNAQNIQHNMQQYRGLQEMQMQEPQGAQIYGGNPYYQQVIPRNMDNLNNFQQVDVQEMQRAAFNGANQGYGQNFEANTQQYNNLPEMQNQYSITPSNINPFNGFQGLQMQGQQRVMVPVNSTRSGYSSNQRNAFPGMQMQGHQTAVMPVNTTGFAPYSEYNLNQQAGFPATQVQGHQTAAVPANFTGYAPNEAYNFNRRPVFVGMQMQGHQRAANPVNNAGIGNGPANNGGQFNPFPNTAMQQQATALSFDNDNDDIDELLANRQRDQTSDWRHTQVQAQTNASQANNSANLPGYGYNDFHNAQTFQQQPLANQQAGNQEWAFDNGREVLSRTQGFGDNMLNTFGELPDNLVGNNDFGYPNVRNSMALGLAEAVYNGALYVDNEGTLIGQPSSPEEPDITAPDDGEENDAGAITANNTRDRHAPGQVPRRRRTLADVQKSDPYPRFPASPIPDEQAVLTLGPGLASGANHLALFGQDNVPRTIQPIMVERGREGRAANNGYPPADTVLPARLSLEEICARYPNHVWGSLLRIFLSEGWTGGRIWEALPADARLDAAMTRPWNYIQAACGRENRKMQDEDGIPPTPVQRRQRRNQSQSHAQAQANVPPLPALAPGPSSAAGAQPSLPPVTGTPTPGTSPAQTPSVPLAVTIMQQSLDITDMNSSLEQIMDGVEAYRRTIWDNTRTRLEVQIATTSQNMIYHEAMREQERRGTLWRQEIANHYQGLVPGEDLNLLPLPRLIVRVWRLLNPRAVQQTAANYDNMATWSGWFVYRSLMKRWAEESADELAQANELQRTLYGEQ
ncbi:hypothetical protein HRR94_000406 [Exophiala dermatitidis]|nr:hypothetical protein HRR94_000406 [Exophiala dermatitidis]